MQLHTGSSRAPLEARSEKLPHGKRDKRRKSWMAEVYQAEGKQAGMEKEK